MGGSGRPRGTRTALLAVWAWTAACGANPTDSAEALSDAYASAVERGDLAALTQLVCWDQVDPRGREAFERRAREELGLGVVETSLEPVPPTLKLEYRLEGVTYRPNLEPVARLRVEFEATPPGEPPRPRSTSHLLALREGAYCIAVNAPVAEAPAP